MLGLPWSDFVILLSLVCSLPHDFFFQKKNTNKCTLAPTLPPLRLYKELAQEMGFEEFHLYLRPVHFEFASHKDKVDPPPPVFMTSLLEDSSRVDR